MLKSDISVVDNALAKVARAKPMRGNVWVCRCGQRRLPWRGVCVPPLWVLREHHSGANGGGGGRRMAHVQKKQRLDVQLKGRDGSGHTYGIKAEQSTHPPQSTKEGMKDKKKDSWNEARRTTWLILR